MVGIRLEDKNVWERRVPLTPDHVAALIERHDIDFVVQPFSRRAFPDADYVTAGAAVRTDLGDCKPILCVKEIPIGQVSPAGVYLCFSHTTKGQAYNMPLLRRFLDLNCTLIDYEHVVDRYGRRLIFFGRHAGYAGMLDALWALGKRLAAEGIRTPLERVRLAHEYPSLDEATRHMSRIGEQIRHDGLPQQLRPLVCGFTGSGNVRQGALEIIQRLPTIDVVPAELDRLMRDDRRPLNVLYTLRLGRSERYVRREGGSFDNREFFLHPERYQSGAPRWLDHLTLLIHGAYWYPPQPRIVTLDDLGWLWQNGPPRLRVIADISCDIDGAIESTVKATSPGDPVYVYDLDQDRAVDGIAGRGPVMMTVDNLPCQLPVESSQHFGDALARFVPALDGCDWNRGVERLNLPEAVRRAIVTHRGELTAGFAHLRQFLNRD
jgi:saccharopine dehydrogenase (NAD+, L-lysine-forming)